MRSDGQSPVVANEWEEKARIGPYSGTRMHNALHTSQCVVEHSLTSQLLVPYGWMEVQTKKQNDLLQTELMDRGSAFADIRGI